MKIQNTSNIHRYTKFALPSWRYIPKYDQHPNKNPHINHIPKLADTALKFSSENWQKSKRYLYAIDLFNHQYYWEVHEVLERLWLESGKKSPEGIFLQGIIQLSVALLKKIQLNTTGTLRLTKKTLPKLHSQQGIYLGIDIEAFIEQYKLFIDDKTATQLVITLQFYKNKSI